MKLAALLLAAPVIYGWIGLGALGLLGRARERVALAPLLGLCISGWLVELALLLGGIPRLVPIGLGLLALLALRPLREGWAREWLSGALLFALAYGVGIVLFALSPMPAVGLWGTDWVMYLRAGPALLAYAGDPAAFAAGLPELMAERPRLFASRPHLFGVAIAPLAPFLAGTPSLVVLEVMACVAGGSLVSALAYVAHRLERPVPSLRQALLLLALPLFSLHLLTLWPKLAAAACVIVALVDAYVHRTSGRRADLAWAWAWLGFGIALHHSSALYAPALIAIVAWDPTARSRLRGADLLRALGLGTVLVLATAGVYEIWALARLGLAARVASNPAVHQAASFDPGFVLLKSAKQIGLAVVGGSFPHLARQLGAIADAASTPAALGHLATAISSWLVFLAGTFLGNLLPLLAVARREVVGAWRGFRRDALFVPILAGGLVALVGSAVLAPILHLSAAQLGATPICVALVFFVVSGPSVRPAALRRALALTAGIGTAPLLVLLLATRVAFARALAGDRMRLDWLLAWEGDTRLMLSLDTTSLAQAMGPAAWLALGMVLALSLWGWRGRA